MRPIRREITVEASPEAVAALWPHFVRWVLSGQQRLACDELACLDAASSGLVDFQPAEGGRSTVAFSLDADGPAQPSAEVLTQRIIGDLVIFKDYVERVHRGGATAEHERIAQAEADVRRDRDAPRERISNRDGSISYTDHFPT